MQRISEADGGTKDGRFQDGNPLNGTGATRVTAEWLNAVQTEIANVILSRGITLDQKDEGQLLKAITDIYQYGLKPLTFYILNGVSSATDLPAPGVVFNKDQIRAVRFQSFSIRHSSKVDDIVYAASHTAIYSTYRNQWSLLTELSPEVLGSTVQPSQPVGATLPMMCPHLLSITAGGKLQYQTTMIEGDAYEGTLILSHFNYLKL